VRGCGRVANGEEWLKIAPSVVFLPKVVVYGNPVIIFLSSFLPSRTSNFIPWFEHP